MKQIVLILIVSILLGCACSGYSDEVAFTEPAGTLMLSVNENLAQSTPRTPNATMSEEIESPTVLPSTKSTVTLVAASSATPRQSVPTISASKQPTQPVSSELLFEGSTPCPLSLVEMPEPPSLDIQILFSTETHDEMWGLEIDTLSLKKLLSTTMDYGISISPGHTKITWDTYRQFIYIFDVVNQEFVQIPWEDEWTDLRGWITDDTVRIDTISNESVVLNVQRPDDRFIEPSPYRKIQLPDLEMGSENPWRGFLQADSEQRYVLYTATGDTEPSIKPSVDLVLWDDLNQQEIWRYPKAMYGWTYPIAEWSGSQSQFLTTLIPNSDVGFNEELPLQFVSITLEGVVTHQISVHELPILGNEYVVLHHKWAESGDYVYFEAYWPFQFGTGYIADIQTGEVVPFCETDFGGGWWLPDDHLLYLVDHDDEPDELVLLNARTWEYFPLLKSQMEIDEENIIGWVVNR